MHTFKKSGSILFLLLCFSFASEAQIASFKEGTKIKGFGKYATVDTATVNSETVMKVAFDVGKAANAGQVNRQIESLARFIHMHLAAGVAMENIHLALVVHGKASFDLLDNVSYQKVHQQNNASKPLIVGLLANNVRVILCGQTAAAYEISLPQLIKGAEIELSAMTAHALLQQNGYTLNPF